MSKSFTQVVNPSTTPVTITVEIPDPTPTLTGNVIGFQQADPKITQSGNSGTIINFIVPQIPITDPEIYNPGRGLMDFFGQKLIPTYPSKLSYTRIPWSQLEVGDGINNWIAFDAEINAVKAKGQKLCFRLGMVDTTGIYGYVNINGVFSFYPQYLHNIMQGESVKDYIYTNTDTGKQFWLPNWNSEALLSRWERLLNALSKHIADNNWGKYIYTIDDSGYGNYQSEDHMYSINEGAAKATDATRIRFLKAMVTSFPDFWLTGNCALYDNRAASDAVAQYALTLRNNRGPLGYRSDHVGWTGTTDGDKQRMNRTLPNGMNILTEIQKRYQYAPCFAEPMNLASLAPYQGVVDETNYFHFSVIENVASDNSSGTIANFNKASKLSGYRIGISMGSLEGNKLTINWFNNGNSPAYDRWVYIFEIRDSSGKALWTSLPVLLRSDVGNTTTIDTIVRQTGNLFITVKDSEGYLPTMNLANLGRNSDGSYLLAAIK